MQPVRAKKSLGQNFLQDPHYLTKIVEAACVSNEDQVLEIGPGMGHLTRRLADRAGRVLALELDQRLVPLLQQEFRDSQDVEIVQADALEYDFGSLSGRWKVVANLPYYISTPIIQRLLNCRERFTSLTLMLQRRLPSGSPRRRAARSTVISPCWSSFTPCRGSSSWSRRVRSDPFPRSTQP